MKKGRKDSQEESHKVWDSICSALHESYPHLSTMLKGAKDIGVSEKLAFLALVEQEAGMPAEIVRTAALAKEILAGSSKTDALGKLTNELLGHAGGRR